MKFSGRFIVILSGPTAVGKTEVAIELAESFGMEIVNADSLQVYRYLDIGTAKPSPEERRRIPHHLIDVVNPDDHFDAGTYQEMADSVIQNLWNETSCRLLWEAQGFTLEPSREASAKFRKTKTKAEKTKSARN